ncbi:MULTISPECIES: hypothetical protein [unclassified Rhizobium]|uniref:hypothetical protein n=1 Tax=Rhizobium TaxID=379 RepID=UPI00084BFB25|nr:MULTISPECIES: hypothetical protein [unclassified Rhizobium]OEC97458.1 hypothetical protein A9Z06_26175 [Rhizobium sp. YK2]QYA14315.1 hypothetical protein J5284_08990 [Rhizobium sp. AB2/73]UEQ79752.1 hypothetical protein I8E17_13010 [Rhizobium sp. AB2/73]
MREMPILYLLLIAALSVAILAAVLPANSYQTQGIDALDCDGPASVLLFAVPALLIFRASAILLYRKRNRRLHLVTALRCVLVFCSIGWNAAAALRESYGPASAEACA